MTVLLGTAKCRIRAGDVVTVESQNPLGPDRRCLCQITTIQLTEQAYFSSQARPSVISCILLPLPFGLTKIVSSASPRFRLSMEELGVIRSLPSLVQPWPLRFVANSAQTLFTFALLLKDNCSTSALYSKSAASFVSARSLTLSLSCVGLGAAFSFNSGVGSLVPCLSVVSCSASFGIAG